MTKPQKQVQYATTVGECVAQGPGRYNFRDSLYLVVRGGALYGNISTAKPASSRHKCYGSAVGAAPVKLMQARALARADWLERRNGRQIAGKRSTTPAKQRERWRRVITKLFSVARDQYLEEHAAEWSDDHRKSLRAMLLNTPRRSIPRWSARLPKTILSRCSRRSGKVRTARPATEFAA